MDWAATLKSPRKEYLLFQPTLAIKRPRGMMLELAIQKETSIFESNGIVCRPKGITKQLMKSGIVVIPGTIMLPDTCSVHILRGI